MNSSVAPLAPCKYRTGKTLGQGTYAVVKEVFHIDTGKKYAAKVLNKKLMRGREHMARNEINVLTKVSKGNQNIITLVDYFETTNNLYLVMDLATGGELFDRICILGSFYEDKAAELVKTIVQAVAYLHKEGIVHRDLKPENLLFETDSDDSPLLIADFGLSKIINPEDFYMLTTLCGTPGYMAPEIYLKKGHGQPVDMWAIGVITYFLLNGSPPFDHPTNKDQMQAIIDAKFSFEPKEYWDPISQTAKDFISRCLVADPEARMTAEEALDHAWLKEPGEHKDEAPTQDLLPNVRRKLSTRKKSLKKIVNAVRTVNYMKQIQEALPLEEDITNQDVLHAH